MLSTTAFITATIVILALGFDFINGFHDTANAIASSVSTRVLSPRTAIIMASILNFLGAFISTKVAKTVGADMVDPNSVPQTVMISALIAAILWNLITWYLGIPSSSSHALIGGLIGSAVVFTGTVSIVHWSVFFTKVLLWLLISPVIGFFVGFIFMNLLNFIFRSTRPATVTKIFSKAQIFSSALIAFNHGGNDAQKSMGIIAMSLLSGGLIQEFHVPIWVKLACAMSMAFGTSIGGWRIIKTIGQKMAKLTPVNGFAVDTSAAAVIFTATMLHAPVSTTHIISTSIMGVGAAKRLSSVRWGVALNIVWTWVLTIPSCFILSGIVISIIKLFS